MQFTSFFRVTLSEINFRGASNPLHFEQAEACLLYIRSVMRNHSDLQLMNALINSSASEAIYLSG